MPELINHHGSEQTTELVNHAFRLASRPIGLPTRDNWELTEEPVRDPGEGRGARQGVVHLARSRDARLE